MIFLRVMLSCGPQLFLKMDPITLFVCHSLYLASSGTSSNENGPQYMSIEAFKAQVSADAEERSRLRAERRAKAEHFKSQANEFFKVGDWENAITRYTKAINACQDWFVLYTNRAQASNLFLWTATGLRNVPNTMSSITKGVPSSWETGTSSG